MTITTDGGGRRGRESHEISQNDVSSFLQGVRKGRVPFETGLALRDLWFAGSSVLTGRGLACPNKFSRIQTLISWDRRLLLTNPKATTTARTIQNLQYISKCLTSDLQVCHNHVKQ